MIHSIRYRFALPPVLMLALLALSLFMVSLQASHADELVHVDPQTIKAEAWLILDGDSGQILAQTNAHARRAPASLTKMMVAYLTLQQIKIGKLHLDELLTVPQEVNHVASDESRMYLHAGEQIKVSDLLTGLLVTSANDAAVTLSTHIAGSMPQFIDRMNEAASRLGLNDTHFANVSGITQEDHYTSAYDMATLSLAIIRQYPEYTNFSRIQHFSYGAFSEAATNRLLKTDPSVDGMKTGYTSAAGFNIVITAKRPQPGLSEDRRVFVVVLGSTSLSERARTAGILLNAAFQQTQNIALLKRHQPLAQVKLWQAKQDQLIIRAPQNVFITVANPAQQAQAQPLPLANAEPESVADMLKVAAVPAQNSQALIAPHYILNLKQTAFSAPLSQNEILGHLKIEYPAQTTIDIDLLNDTQIERAGFFKRLWDNISLFFQNLFNIKTQVKQLI